MNRNIIFIAAIAAALGIGLLIGRGSTPQHDAETAVPAEREILYWVAPMDPNYRRDEPGKSPMGMDLVPVCPEAAESGSGAGVYIDPVLVQNMGVKLALL